MRRGERPCRSLRRYCEVWMETLDPKRPLPPSTNRGFQKPAKASPFGRCQAVIRLTALSSASIWARVVILKSVISAERSIASDKSSDAVMVKGHYAGWHLPGGI